MDKKTNELRDRIIGVAIEAFHQQGIRQVTMDSIAHRLTISKRTLYQQFEDKEALVLACLSEREKRNEAFLQQIMSETDNVLTILLRVFSHSMDEIGHICPAFFKELAGYPSVVAAYQSRRDEEIEKGVAFMERGAEQGYFNRKANFRIVIAFMQQALDHVLENKSLANASLRDIFINTLMIVLRGCATREGIIVIDNFMAEFNRED